MSNYSSQYLVSSYTIPQGNNYSSYQNNYPSSYSSYNSYSVYPSTKYSNNSNNFNYGLTNGYNIYNNSSFIQAKTNPTNFSSSNNYNNYITNKSKILPPKIYYSYQTVYPMDTNNYPNNKYIKTSYQPPYINTNNTKNIIPKTSYNIITKPNKYTAYNNILELTVNSTKSLAYGTIISPISNNEYNETNLTFNNSYVISGNNSFYSSQINPQNSFVYKYNQPSNQNLVQYNPNLVSKLKRSYFNEKKLSYSVSSYEPIRPSKKNYNILDEYINSNFDLVKRYSTSSVPVKGNLQNVPEIDDDIISIEEVELFPNKNKNYIKKTIKFNKRNSLAITPQVKNKYYIPKDFPSTNSFIRLPARVSKIDYTTSTLPLNTVSTVSYNTNRKGHYNTNSSYRIDFPYDNNNNDKSGIYQTKIYRINLNDKKMKKKKIF